MRIRFWPFYVVTLPNWNNHIKSIIMVCENGMNGFCNVRKFALFAILISKNYRFFNFSMFEHHMYGMKLGP